MPTAPAVTWRVLYACRFFVHVARDPVRPNEPRTLMATRTSRPGTKRKAIVPPEDWTPSQVAANEITQQYRDLEPSVNRIMTADLGEDGRMHAITLFRESLGVPGDPNRIPVNAIEAGRLAELDQPAG
jgi:hypothetical protein